MTNIDEFFIRLNDNIDIARTKKALKNLDKIGTRYVNNLPSEIDPKVRRKSMQQLKQSRTKIKNRMKSIN